MPSQEDIEQQQQLLATHRRTLAHLLVQQAQFSAGHIPAHIANGIVEARTNIHHIKQVLGSWNILVDDRPDDANASPILSNDLSSSHLDLRHPVLIRHNMFADANVDVILQQLEAAGFILESRRKLNNGICTQLRFETGEVVNVYDNGSVLPQGKNQDAVRKIIGRVSIPRSTRRKSKNPTEPELQLPLSTTTRPLNIFMCHSSKDTAIVRGLYQRLRTEGFAPWFSEEDLIPGQKWEREIGKIVRSTDVVIVCLSPRSTKKGGYFQKEITYALNIADQRPEDEIFIIPAKLEVCNIPNRINHLHCVDLSEERGFDRLIRTLQERTNKLINSGRIDLND